MLTPQQEPLHQVHPIEAGTLRQVCGLFVTGVAVITSGMGDHATGTTVNSFTSVSLDPPLVLFCLHNRSRLQSVLRESGSFGVNFLAGRQESVAWAFAGKKTTGFHEVSYRRCAGDVPILGEALAFLACRIVDEFPGGDHSIVVGEVIEAGIPRRQEPLIFFEGSFGVLEEALQAGHPIWDG